MPALEVYYCSVCTLPPEYCEYAGTPEVCKTALKSGNPSLFKNLYPDEMITDSMDQLAVNESDESAVKTDKPAQKGKNKKEKSKSIIVKRAQRNKRKHITTINGLELFDVDLKKAAKLFANKFACGASVSKNAQGNDEIVVQGDINNQFLSVLESNWPNVPTNVVVFAEEKKKKQDDAAEGETDE